MSNTKADCFKILESLPSTDGWHDGQGFAIDSQAISMAILLIGLVDWLKPYIYPTLEGGITFEWDGNWKDMTEHHTLTFKSDHSVRYWYFTDYPEDEQTDENELDLDVTWQNSGVYCVANTLNFHHTSVKR